MAATKTPITLLNAVTTTQTSSAGDVSADYVQSLYVEIVQVGTPSVAAQFQPQWSPDASKYYNGPIYKTDLAAGTYHWTIPAPPDAKGVKVSFTAQTGGTSSTCTAHAGAVSGI